jgi:hypothetical protein
MTAMQEFVVPKSMPSIFAIKLLDYVGVVVFYFFPKPTLRACKLVSYGVNTPDGFTTNGGQKSFSMTSVLTVLLMRQTRAGSA